jgi:hypothetical protein
VGVPAISTRRPNWWLHVVAFDTRRHRLNGALRQDNEDTPDRDTAKALPPPRSDGARTGSVMQRQRPRRAPRNGVDAAMAFGATAVGRVRPSTLIARGNTTCAIVTTLVRQLRVAMWAVGAGSAAELAPGRLRG